ncbi:hypothetical protein IS446_01180 [Robertkochia sp. 1368]|nr:hypothetical protein [Robertkochia sediminum]
MIYTLFLLCFAGTITYAQSLQDLDQYRVDEFYKKIDLDYGTLDDDGYPIDHIYVRTEVDPGDYQIELTDADGDLYEIKGTNLYVTFMGYFGYAGYGTECILKVEQYSAMVYKLE